MSNRERRDAINERDASQTMQPFPHPDNLPTALPMIPIQPANAMDTSTDLIGIADGFDETSFERALEDNLFNLPQPIADISPPPPPVQPTSTAKVPPLDLTKLHTPRQKPQPYGPVKSTKQPLQPIEDISPLKQELVTAHLNDRREIDSLRDQLQQQITRSEQIEWQANTLVASAQEQVGTSTRHLQEEAEMAISQQQSLMRQELEITLATATSEMQEYEKHIQGLQTSLHQQRDLLTDQHTASIQQQQSQMTLQCEQALSEKVHRVRTEAQEQITILNTNTNKLQQQYSQAMQQQQQQHTEQLDQHIERLNAASARNSALQNENRDLQRQLEQSNNHILALQATDTDQRRDAQIQELQIRHEASLKQSGLRYNELHHKMVEQNNHAQQTIQNQTTDISTMQATITAQQDTISSLQTRNDSLTLENTTLHAQIKQLQDQLMEVIANPPQDNSWHSCPDDGVDGQDDENEEPYNSEWDGEEDAWWEDEFIPCELCGENWQTSACCEVINAPPVAADKEPPLPPPQHPPPGLEIKDNEAKTTTETKATTPRDPEGKPSESPNSPIQALANVFAPLIEVLATNKGSDKKWGTESAEVKLDRWPRDAAEFPSWWTNICRIIAAASGRPQLAHKWIMEIPDAATWEEIITDSDHETLDFKIRVSMDHIAPAEFKRQIDLLDKNLEPSKGMIGGRQSLWLMFQSFKTDDIEREIKGVTHLISLRIQGNNLQLFLDQWDAALAKIPTCELAKDERWLTSLFLAQIEDVPALKLELQLYKREIRPKPPAYDDLRALVKEHLKSKKEAANSNALKNAPALGLAAYTAGECRFFRRGGCSRGNACSFLHIPANAGVDKGKGKKGKGKRGTKGKHDKGKSDNGKQSPKGDSKGKDYKGQQKGKTNQWQQQPQGNNQWQQQQQGKNYQGQQQQGKTNQWQQPSKNNQWSPKGQGKGKYQQHDGQGGKPQRKGSPSPNRPFLPPLGTTVQKQATLRGVSPSGRENAKPCINYLKGHCQHGRNCGYWHTPQCRHFLRGTCVMGDKRIMKHGKGKGAWAAPAAATQQPLLYTPQTQNIGGPPQDGNPNPQQQQQQQQPQQQQQQQQPQQQQQQQQQQPQSQQPRRGRSRGRRQQQQPNDQWQWPGPHVTAAIASPIQNNTSPQPSPASPTTTDTPQHTDFDGNTHNSPQDMIDAIRNIDW